MNKKITFLLLVFLVSFRLYGQFPQVNIGKDFNTLPLTDLIKYVETRHAIKFFYLNKWTDSINVIQQSISSSLEQVLKESLLNSKISYFSDNQGNIILSYKYKIETALPSSLLNLGQKSVQENKILEESSFIRSGQTRIISGSNQDEIITIGIPGNLSRNSKADLSGVIREKETGQPILGAVVYVNDLNVGTITDLYGYYVLSIPPGNHELLVRYLGRKDQVHKILVNGNGTLDLMLEEKMIELRGVVITADKEQNVKGLQLGLDKLDIQTIKQMPSNMGEVDLIKTTLLLPGVQTVGEGASGFNVRGGNTDQNLILMDGAPLFNSSHMLGFFSVFNPDVVKDFKLYKSGIPAQYGGRLSSVLDVSLKEGNHKKISLSGGLSPIAGRLSLDGPIIKEKASFLVSGRGTYSDWLLHRVDVPTLKNSSALFFDLNAKFDYSINEKNQFAFSGYYSEDHFKLNFDTAYNFSNLVGSASLKHTFSKKIYALFSGIYSNYTYSIESVSQLPYAFNLNHFINYKEAKTDFTWFLNLNHKVNFGANVINYRINPGTLSPAGAESIIIPKELPDERALETGIYLSDEYNVTNNLSLSFGLRYSGFITLGPSLVYKYVNDAPRSVLNRIDSTYYPKNSVSNHAQGPELRFSARYKTGPSSSVKVNFARMYQYLHMLSNTTAISPTDVWKVSGPLLPAQKSRQYSAGYYKDFMSNTVEASIEMYYKTSENILEYRGGTKLLMNPALEVDLLEGMGKAYGLEILFKKKYGALNGWVSYSYSRSLIKVDSKYLIDQINQGKYFPSNYDKPHDFTLVSNYRFSRLHSISSTLTYSTGRPITFPVAKYRFKDRELIHYSNRNEYRIPNYFRWDVSLNIEGNLKAKRFVRDSFSISVYNLTGKDNAYSIFFVSDPVKRVKGYKLSVFSQPIFSVTYNFKF
jgi:hypothetical protein